MQRMNMWFQIRTLLLIIAITLINYMDRSAISFAILPIETELGLNNAYFGWIAAGFGFGYTAGNFFSGWFVDRFGPVRSWAVSATLWSIITMIMGSASGFWTFFFLRIALGCAEATHFPSLLKTASEYLPRRSRAQSIALGLCGIPTAMIIASPCLAWIIQTEGWRTMFVWLGTLGFLWSGLWIWSFYRHRSKIIKAPDAFPNLKKLSLHLLRSPTFRLNCAIFFAFGYTLFLSLAWLPGYFQQIFDLSLKQTGLILIAPWSVAALSLFLGGMVSDRLLNKTGNLRLSRCILIGIGMAVSAISFLFLAHTQNLPLAVFLCTLGLGGAFFINAPIYALNADIFPSYVASAQGLMVFFSAMAAILAPALTGILSHLTGTFMAAFYCVSALSFLAAVLALFVQKPRTTVTPTNY